METAESARNLYVDELRQRFPKSAPNIAASFSEWQFIIPHPISDGKSRWDCASLLKEERDDRENRVEDERRDRERAIGRGRLAQERVACLNQDQRRNENDDAD